MENDSTLLDLGINLFDEEIDDVIFKTNEFLTDATFTGAQGPFWWILQLSMAIAGMFAICVIANMAYKMMIKREPLEVMKLFKPFMVSIVLMWWYPPANTGMVNSDNSWCVLDFLAYVPNAIGSYTHDLFEAEAEQVKDRYEAVKMLLYKRKDLTENFVSQIGSMKTILDDYVTNSVVQDATGVDDVSQEHSLATKEYTESLVAGFFILIDQLIMCLALIIYKIGWWAIIYAQQILLGMLTIFGPIQWAFSLLQRWEGAWAKWIIRYLTVHFYGAMLYFVGFYILLLFDVVINIQYNDIAFMVDDPDQLGAFIKNMGFSALYLLCASVVSLQCLNLVPDLAAWMIPEGDTAFSTRSFGYGIAHTMSEKANKVIKV